MKQLSGNVRKNTTFLVLSVLVIALMILSLLLQFFILSKYSPESTIVDARATTRTSHIGMCFNHPPIIVIPCNSSLIQNTSYYCALNVTDGDVGQTFVYTMFIKTASNRFDSSKNVTFYLTANGVLNFTPTNDDVGNYTLNFSVQDSSNCSNGISTGLLAISIANINDGPYLVKNIPEVKITVNRSISPFKLTDYFKDPDLDIMNFSVTNFSDITIEILPDSRVVFTSTICSAKQKVKFMAVDPYGLYAESNEVEVKVDCSGSQGGNSGSDSSSGGSGGGASPMCKSVWECDDWMQCLPTGYQWQRCYDMKGCEPEKYFKRTCVYQNQTLFCQENWLCTPWGKCWLNDTQYRTCNDLGFCGTNVTLPPVEQGCIYQPTCNDGIQNGDEVGVDCGGSLCPVCAIVQEPSLLEDGTGLSLWFILMITLSILLVSGIVRYYRSEIAQLMAMIGFMLKHRSYKDILLDSLQRKALFERIRGFEQLLASEAGVKLDANTVYSSIAVLTRQYLSEALLLKEEMNLVELDARCKELNLRPETTMLLRGVFSKLEIIEQADLEIDLFFAAATLEELRTLVCLTSQYSQEELLRPVEEVPITTSMSFYDEIFARSINSLRALQYQDMEEAKKGYVFLLSKYDALVESEKESIYPELMWLFHTIKFSSEMTGARIVNKNIGQLDSNAHKDSRAST